jgi:kynurenine formamidase
MAERSGRRNPQSFALLLRGKASGSDAVVERGRRVVSVQVKEAIMCVPGCQESLRAALSRRGFFTGAAAAGFAATAIVEAEAQTKKKPQAETKPDAKSASKGERYFKGVVDLTHTMSPEFPTFFGVPGIEMQKQYDFKKDGFNLNWWKIVEHAGTHLDAPIHFSENGATADKIVVGELVVPLAVVDVRKQAEKEPDYLMGIEDVLVWEKRFGKLPNNCCVAMMSGWSKHVGDAAKYTGKDSSGTFHFPGISPELTEWLLKDRNVLGLAVDTLSLDNGPSKDFKTHHLWLPSGRWGLENVANLDKLSPSEATLVVGLPKVKDSTGGPVRLIALI